jgi:long-subunit fatty acid transport protein
MADAFVAIADDATAASWNPAGLVQLERPEVSAVGSMNGVVDQFDAWNHPEVESSHSVYNLNLNYLSVAYPLPLPGRNATVSFNYQRKYDFSRRFKLHYDRSAPLLVFQEMDFEQEGGLSTLTPAFAIELTHRLSLGLSLNLWRSSLFSENGWEQFTTTKTEAFFGSSFDLSTLTLHSRYRDFSGENLALGLLWNVTDKWSLAARYDTAFTGRADYEECQTRTHIPAPVQTTVKQVQETRGVRFPATVAVGIAHRFNDRLTLSLDVTRTDWNDFYVKDAFGNRFSLVDFSDLDIPQTRPHFDPTYTVRLGMEHVFIPAEPEEKLNTLWSLRCGLFYDEEPATGRSRPSGFELVAGRGSGEPDRFYGFAVGAGLLAYQRVNFDVAYQLRYGNDVNRDFVRGVTGFREDTVQHRILLSTVLYF